MIKFIPPHQQQLQQRAHDTSEDQNQYDDEDEDDYEESQFDSEPMHSGRHVSGRQSNQSNRRFIPIEFAKQHILKIEDDMKKMHERHVKLMREMDENYQLIEQET